MIRLILNYEGSDLPTHELFGDFVFIGRAPSNQIVIDHPAVSAQHALLLRVRDFYWLKDLNSTNGTQINGDFVTDAELKDGDKIRFGSVLAVFVGRCYKRTSKLGLENSGRVLRSKPDARRLVLVHGVSEYENHFRLRNPRGLEAARLRAPTSRKCSRR